jgi:hypothetical protein
VGLARLYQQRTRFCFNPATPQIGKPARISGRDDWHGKTGADFFRGATDLLHVTYFGYHGETREWLTYNPEMTKELLNLCGYWLFPPSQSICRKRSSPVETRRLRWSLKIAELRRPTHGMNCG